MGFLINMMDDLKLGKVHFSKHPCLLKATGFHTEQTNCVSRCFFAIFIGNQTNIQMSSWTFLERTTRGTGPELLFDYTNWLQLLI